MIRARTLQDLFKRYRRPGDLFYAIICVLFSVFMVFSLRSQTVWVDNTKLFAQPAFWPHLAAWAMLAFSLLHLLSTLVSPRLAGRWQEVWFWIRSAEFALWFMGYVVIVPLLGYLPSTILFTVALSLRLGYRGPKYLGSAVLFAIAVVVVFKSLLQVKVPGGAAYELLPTALRSFFLTYL
ncbi:MAG: hypothetical protein KatS3mg118_1374 [Paracoccaceae bacterium]|nr:MAG: hypothetical protein KatS3mg118_1374 [Paracoccaceae bacterium]